ncbi:Uncharacterised protein [Phocoenobacter uteri]|uniref:Uncharacterized protein n=1 Tax=Phocoenobacter uteri TaxID=146806 RepID=A0A379DFW1_9PAST|nr:hypothetical protein [Phocoenobacter uteri]MDG6882779.1 hypothetical protein [Phocoenobacter uteri]SUB58947.1 Uncharacterised protein [Phocoenobacter uteri]SUB76442.1 Uncharacterised protein [Phocoenobacter uteri]
MKGSEFKWAFNQVESQFKTLKDKLGVTKLNAKEMVTVRENLSRNFKFASGVLSAENKALIGSETATVWLSDDTLIKQLNSRDGDIVMRYCLILFMSLIISSEMEEI